MWKRSSNSRKVDSPAIVMMGLPDFINAAVGFFKTTDSKLDALAKSGSEVERLGAQVSTLTAENANLATKISQLETGGSTQAAVVVQMTGEIETLKASVETERKRANDVISAQGLALEKLPKQEPAASHASAKDKSKLNLTEQCIAANKAAALART